MTDQSYTEPDFILEAPIPAGPKSYAIVNYAMNEQLKDKGAIYIHFAIDTKEGKITARGWKSWPL